jgi:hypothetical protein
MQKAQHKVFFHFTQKSGARWPRFFVSAIYLAVNAPRYLRVGMWDAKQKGPGSSPGPFLGFDDLFL